MDAKYQNITQYMAKNKLILNTNKTHLLVMASKRQHKINGDFGISLNTGNEIIQPTCNEKLLGAIISNDMEWSMHIRDHKESLQRNLSTRLNALTKVCMIADFATRKLVSNGIFMSSLINLIQLWSGTTDTLLQVTQNRAARLVTKLPPTTSCETLLRQVGWLSVRQLSVYHSMIMVFNIRRTGRPYNFSKSFHSHFLVRLDTQMETILTFKAEYPIILDETILHTGQQLGGIAFLVTFAQQTQCTVSRGS